MSAPDPVAGQDPLLPALCSVCAHPAAPHLHYGAISCYSCRAFFRRGQPRKTVCAVGRGGCSINQQNRTNCKGCRYNKCLQVGMKPGKVDATLAKRREKDASIIEAERQQLRKEQESEANDIQETFDHTNMSITSEKYVQKVSYNERQRLGTVIENKAYMIESGGLNVLSNGGSYAGERWPYPYYYPRHHYQSDPSFASQPNLQPRDTNNIKQEPSDNVNKIYFPQQYRSDFPSHLTYPSIDNRTKLIKREPTENTNELLPPPLYYGRNAFPKLLVSSDQQKLNSLIIETLTATQLLEYSAHRTPSQVKTTPRTNQTSVIKLNVRTSNPKAAESNISVITSNSRKSSNPITKSFVEAKPKTNSFRDEEVIEPVVKDVPNFSAIKIRCVKESLDYELDAVINNKRRRDSGYDEQVTPQNSPTRPNMNPLKKRQRMMEVPYSLGHALNQEFSNVTFTTEEEFTMVDYRIRIEEYTNMRFDFLLQNFPNYGQFTVAFILFTQLGMKIPYDKDTEQHLFKLGLEFTKQNTQHVFHEMGCLSTNVRKEVLNSTYPALYVVFFSILEGNTREKTWKEQHYKTLQITKENHARLKGKINPLEHVRSISIKDQERFSSPWAVELADEEKFEKTIAVVGRVLRDDQFLQALYHMLVMMTPSASSSKETRENPELQLIQGKLSQLIYRYTVKQSLQTKQATPDYRESPHSLMHLSVEVTELSPDDKTRLLVSLVDDIHQCADIMQNKSLAGWVLDR